MNRRSLASEQSEPALGPALDFLRAVWALEHNLQVISRAMTRRIGLSGRQRLALRLIGRFPGISSGRLASILLVHPSTLTSLLTGLERKGLVVKRPHPRDGRRSVLGLSARGRDLDSSAEGAVEQAVNDVLARHSPASAKAAREILTALARALQTR